jgi:phage regulator Rha-like protein
MSNQLVSQTTPIESKILVLRGRRVMLDADIAELFGVTTRHLNQQIKRQRDRFPPDFMFQLTRAEKDEVITKCDHLERLKFSSVLPLAFTEHGALMLANTLRSSVAVRMSIEVVRAFIRLREAMTLHRDLAAKLDALERKYDRQFKVVFDAIRGLMKPPRKRRTARIGFKPSS